ncbi:MAG: hypothetical protein ACKV2Q_10460 [Planctomycetaceae bacterium]
MNPFRDTIVATPWEAADSDVPEIHAEVFEECLRGVLHVRRSGRSAALVIHGGAGSGKTHLLARLRKRLTPAQPPSTEREESLFVWVRLQTSPRTIWRHVRRKLVDDWLRPVPNGKPQYDRVLFHRLAEYRPAECDLERWFEYMLLEHPVDLDELLEGLADHIDLDRNTTVAFKHLAFGRHRRDLRAWLSGESLPEAALARMDLSVEEGTDEEREQQARQVVLMLCRLAGPRLPIVLSFDQVEALQSSPDDRESLFAFGQLASTLHDETNNLLLVSCIQSAFVTQMKDQLRGADYDRMTSLGARSLSPLTRSQAERLIAARLESAAADVRSPVRQNAGLDTPSSDERDDNERCRSNCWPLTDQELNELAQPGDLTPRRLLARCAERFERTVVSANAGGITEPRPSGSGLSKDRQPLPDGRGSNQGFLADTWDARREQALADNLPAHTEDILRHGLPLLMGLIAPAWSSARDPQLPDVELLFDGPAGRVGLSICTQSNMNSLCGRLRRLRNQFTALHGKRLARLIVVRDPRVPITSKATKTRQALEELQRAEVVVRHPSPEVLAALDALRSLLSDAKSGDLDHDGELLTPRTVEDWLRAHLPNSLRDFVDDLTSGSATPSASPSPDRLDFEELATLLAEQPLLSVDDAAQQLQSPTATITATIQQYPDHFGLLLGPPAVVFRATM